MAYTGTGILGKKGASLVAAGNEKAIY